MLTRIGANAIQSSDGFSVRISSNELLYSEHGKAIRIEIEPGDGLAVYASTIKMWENEDESEIEPVSSDDQTRIVENISNALIALGIRFAIY